VNAQEQGRLLNDGIHRELTAEACERIVRVFRAWTGTSGSYRDEEGFCRAVDPVEIEKNHFIMAPQYYTTAQQDAQTELPQTAGLHIERLKSILREEALIDAELLDLLVGFSDVCH
jgi:type I restriction-modification system DNA methylase subunit